MQKLDAVIFDYGNVLCLPPVDEDNEKMAEIVSVDRGNFEEAYWRFREEYDRGVTSNIEYWRQIAGYLNVELSQEEIEKLTRMDVISWSRPNLQVVELLHNLVASGVKVAILSNMPYDLKFWVEGECDWLPVFDHRTYSCELKCVKPDKAIYEHCINGLNLPKNSMVFVDDRIENVEAARNCGIEAIHFTNNQILESYLRNFYVPTRKVPTFR